MPHFLINDFFLIISENNKNYAAFLNIDAVINQNINIYFFDNEAPTRGVKNDKSNMYGQ